MKERMTDRKDVRGVDPKSWGRFDQTVDKITKVMKKVLPVAGLTMATSATIAACNENSPIAEVQPAQSAVLSGLVTSEKISQVMAKDPETAQALQNDFNKIKGLYQGKYIEGTESIYYIYDNNGKNMYFYAFGGVDTGVEGKAGMKVLGYCDQRKNTCIDINKDLVKLPTTEAEVYGWVDNSNKSHQVAIYMKGTDGKYEPVVMVDPNGISYTEANNSGDDLLTRILEFGVTPVEAAYETETPTVEPTEVVGLTGIEGVKNAAFERDIPNLTQEEMKKIVDSAYRYKTRDGSETYSLGCVSKTLDHATFSGIVFDFEKSSTKVDGDEIWRILIITEVQRANSFEIKNSVYENKYIILPLYINNDTNNDYRVSITYTPNGSSIEDEGQGFAKVEKVVDVLEEAKSKFEYFQTQLTVLHNLRGQLEQIKTGDTWNTYQDLIMRIYEEENVSGTFLKTFVSGDYEKTIELIKDEKPILNVVDIVFSTDYQESLK